MNEEEEILARLQNTGFGGFKNRNHWWWDPLVGVPVLVLILFVMGSIYLPIGIVRIARSRKLTAGYITEGCAVFTEVLIRSKGWIVLAVVIILAVLIHQSMAPSSLRTHQQSAAYSLSSSSRASRIHPLSPGRSQRSRLALRSPQQR